MTEIAARQADLYPGNDTLPDISGVTFDHKDRNGNTVKFLWGVATSSYQTEGRITTNDWHVFTGSDDIRERVDFLAKIGRIALSLEGPGDAIDHWDLGVFSEDLKRARSLGMNSYRLSLEWGRIQPKRPGCTDPAVRNNPDDFDTDAVLHYRKMLDMIAGEGMTPIVTLNHTTLPRWVLNPPTSLFEEEDKGFKESLGGWENCDTVGAFVKFVEFVAERLDGVVYWITINEPSALVGLGYIAGIWSPGFLAAHERAKRVFFNLVEAHARAYDAIKRTAGPGVRVGIAHAMVFPRPRPGLDFLGRNEQACGQYDYCFNRSFLEAVVDGIYNPQLILGSGDTTVRNDWKGRLDFVGINYYRSVYIYKSEVLSLAAPWVGGIFDEDLASSDHQHNLLNDLGWEIYPGGLYRFLKYLDGRYGLPVLITENGLAEASDGTPGGEALEGKRGPYIVAHLSQVLHAIKEGVNVIGYLHWTIADNWEWDYDYLAKARFGLYTVDRGAGPKIRPGTALPRKKTRGAEALEYIIDLGRIGDAAAKFGTISPSGDAISRPSGGLPGTNKNAVAGI